MQVAAPRSAASRNTRGESLNGTAASPADEGEALLEALPLAAAIVGLTSKGVLKLIRHNAKFTDVIAQTGDEAMMGGDFRNCIHLHIAAMMSDFLAEGATASELDFADGDGIGARHFRMKLAPLARDPERGSPRCLVCLVDRTVEVRAERSLRAEMLRDSLTGLPNRLSFTEAVEAAGLRSAELRGHDHAVLVVDMRRFSRINELMGSLAGDELLITFARRLISALRTGDVLARTGGNEFGILVGLKRGVDDAIAAAERILRVMTAPFRLSELEIRVECAIGVALMEGCQDPEELFRQAQFAVKQAKASGKPQVYEPKEASAARRRFSIETELRRALDKDQLTLSYQPLIDLKSGQVSGFEALARWTHEDRGEISPVEFIPVAEESGLILVARTMGDGQGRADARRLGPRGGDDAARLRRGQSERDPGGARRHCRSGGGFAAIERAERQSPDARTDRKRGRPGSGARDPRVRIAEGAWADGRDGRFRDRLFEPCLPPAPADRRAQDRPQLRDRDDVRPRQHLDRPRGAEPRRGARHVDHRRGNRDGGTGDDAGRAGLRQRAGLLFRQAARGRARARLLAFAPAGGRMPRRSAAAHDRNGARTRRAPSDAIRRYNRSPAASRR